jgi:hypothetical protein
MVIDGIVCLFFPHEEDEENNEEQGSNDVLHAEYVEEEVSYGLDLVEEGSSVRSYEFADGSTFGREFMKALEEVIDIIQISGSEVAIGVASLRMDEDDY